MAFLDMVSIMSALLCNFCTTDDIENDTQAFLPDHLWTASFFRHRCYLEHTSILYLRFNGGYPTFTHPLLL